MSRETQQNEPADYLWDRSGTPDREVQALEDLLGRFAHQGSGPGEAPPVTARRRGRGWLAALAAVALIAAAALVWRDEITTYLQGQELRMNFPVAQWDTDNTTRVARESSLVQLLDGEETVGELRFSAGSRVDIVALEPGLARLRLPQGRLEATMSAGVPPRFFQVDTPSVLCVDLGSAFALAVDERGRAHLVVSQGRVALVGARGDDLLVPGGAECRATIVGGPGTPRFLNSTLELTRTLEVFDEAIRKGIMERRRLAGLAFEAATSTRDTLALWHLLADADPEISTGAERALLRIAGPPEAAAAQKIVTFTREQWREHLEQFWL